MQQFPGLVAKEPILRVIEESDYDDEEIATLVWPGNAKPIHRLYLLRTGNPYMHFDLADRILCCLGLHWLSSPELEAIYRSADLPALDASMPTCLSAALSTVAAVKNAYESLGNIPLTAERLGLRQKSVQRLRALGQEFATA